MDSWVTIEKSAITSNVRSEVLTDAILQATTVRNDVEHDISRGDVVLCSVRSVKEAAYRALESVIVTNPLKIGQKLVVVVGERHSGRNIYGLMPSKFLKIGESIHLLAIAGLVGRAVFVPPHLGKNAVTLEYLGQMIDDSGKPLNVEHFPRLSHYRGAIKLDSPVVVVCGSSAEVGKTTLVERLITMATARGLRCNAIKLTGTGRLSDAKRYHRAGAAWVADFVDTGFASTYGLSEAEHSLIRSTLLGHVGQSNAKLTIVELGGDLLEGGSPEAIRYFAACSTLFIYLASDALAAKGGYSELERNGAKRIFTVIRNQNKLAFEERLRVKPILDVDLPEDLALIIDEALC